MNPLKLFTLSALAAASIESNAATVTFDYILEENPTASWAEQYYEPGQSTMATSSITDIAGGVRIDFNARTGAYENIRGISFDWNLTGVDTSNGFTITAVNPFAINTERVEAGLDPWENELKQWGPRPEDVDPTRWEPRLNVGGDSLGVSFEFWNFVSSGGLAYIDRNFNRSDLMVMEILVDDPNFNTSVFTNTLPVDGVTSTINVSNYSNVSPTFATAYTNYSNVPEPSAAMLAFLGLLPILNRKRK